jgi:hypothetical protein
MLRMELQTLDALKSTKGDEILLHYPVPCQKRHSRQVRPSSCSAVWLPTPDRGTLRPAPSPFTVLSDLLIIATPPTNKGRIVPGQLHGCLPCQAGQSAMASTSVLEQAAHSTRSMSATNQRHSINAQTMLRIPRGPLTNPDTLDRCSFCLRRLVTSPGGGQPASPLSQTGTDSQTRQNQPLPCLQRWPNCNPWQVQSRATPGPDEIEHPRPPTLTQRAITLMILLAIARGYAYISPSLPCHSTSYQEDNPTTRYVELLRL